MMLGDLKLRVIGKEFYCRYCKDYDECRKAGHRRGIWFKVAIENERNKKAAVIVTGEGEREGSFPFGVDVGKHIRTGMSGCKDYEKGHITMSGWHYLKGIVVEEVSNEKIEKEEVELSMNERILLADLLNRNIIDILRELINRGVTSIEDDWGIWEEKKPIFFVYMRERYIPLPFGAVINEEPQSFKAKFMWDEIEFYISKAQYDIGSGGNYVAVFLGSKYGAKKAIFLSEEYGRKIVYYYDGYRLHGNEIYKSHVHPRAEIQYPTVACAYQLEWYVQLLLKNRLGDVIFLTKDNKEYLENKITWLEPASQAHFKKIKVVDGEIQEKEGIITTTKRTVLFHEEHGVLEIDKDHMAYVVPYSMRGHD